MTSILAFVIVLGVLVSFHELGHYLAARWLGVKVLKFSLGFGPKLFGKQVGDTEYLISALPLGGYVKLFGEEPDEADGGGAPASPALTPEERRQSFAHRPVSHRAAIVAAGPVFNLVLAYLIFTGGLAVGVPMFVPEFESITPVVDAVAPDSPAAAAGLQAGDRITAINDREITTWVEMTTIVRASAGKPLMLDLERGARQLRLQVTPLAKEVELETGEKATVGQIGVQKDGRGSPIEAGNPIEALYKGVEATWKWTELTAIGIFKLLTGQLSKDNIGGPLLIAQMSGNAAQEGPLSVIMFIAILSINLGIINFLPIPVLDGGHLFFFGIEAVLGRPLSLRKREVAQQVGLFLLIALMLFATYNDIVRWFQAG